MTHRITAASIVIALATSPAFAGYAITQGGSTPGYATTLDFDEPGGPTGTVPSTSWQASHGVTIEAGDGQSVVGDNDAAFGGWGLGTGNSFFGNFGVFMTFESDLTAISFRAWDPSGAPSPFGGGMGVFLFNDGVEVSSSFVTPAWGGIGDPWFDVVATDGETIDEVRILGFGFGPTTVVDDLSWDIVSLPCPADTDDSGAVDVDDLVAVILAWGTSDPAADVDGSGLVDVDDIVAVILAWGSC